MKSYVLRSFQYTINNIGLPVLLRRKSMPDGGIFKFLSKEHIDSFISGSIRMGGFDTYSLLELITGDQWIGDKQESISITFLDHLATPNMVMSGNHVISREFGYCLSLSHGNIDKLRHTMAASASPYRYDACIEITDPHRFMQRLGGALEKFFANFRSMGFEGRVVTYAGAGNEYNAKHFNDFNPHDTFLKPAMYSDQSEYRIAVTMDEPDQTQNYLQIEISDLSDIVRQVEMPSAPNNYKSPFNLSEEEARSQIRATLAAIEKFDGTEHFKYENAAKDLIYAYGCLRFSSIDFRHPELDLAIRMHELERRIPPEKMPMPYWWPHQIIGYIRMNSAIFT